MYVEQTYDGERMAHYRVQRTKDAPGGWTVRIGRHGIPVCLSCVKTDCEHADAVAEFLSTGAAA